MIARALLGVSAAGFVLSAAVHLTTFVDAAPPVPGGATVVLLVAAFVPLAAMVRRLRISSLPIRRWRRLRFVDWRALLERVPPGIRWLTTGMAAYVVMNVLLSMLLVGTATASRADGRYYVSDRRGLREVAREEWAAVERVSMRLVSGHLLLMYLIPLVYFRFVEGRPGPEPAARR